jgi:PEP-CTERM motif
MICRPSPQLLSPLAASLLFIVCSGPVLADTPFGVVGSPIDISAFVQESLLPGGTLAEQSQPIFGTQASPKQSAQLLLPASTGSNFSGRSTNIDGAFASSLAESDGNGGVGVTSWIASDPSRSHPGSIDQLAARSMWTQTFLYNGTPTVNISLHLHIPSLQVGLIGVPPNLTHPSATETASAIAMVTSVITHPDGTFSRGADFEFGLKAFELQAPLGPSNFANAGVIDFVDVGTGFPTVDLFKTLRDNFVAGEHNFTPQWTIDSVSTSVKLGTLKTGDIVSYVYTLSAQGTTRGGEQGYDAFLGDPFGVDIVSGNLVPEVTLSVPEPETALLLLAGLCGLGWRRRARG